MGNVVNSFNKDHLTLEKGFYVSEAKGVVTVDVRMKKPYRDNPIEPDVLHALEHMLATAARCLYGDEVIYIGPMGCRTGMYFLFTQSLYAEKGNGILKSIFYKALEFGDIPGKTYKECGNARDFESVVIYECTRLEIIDYLVYTLKEESFFDDILSFDEFKEMFSRVKSESRKSFGCGTFKTAY